MAGQNKVKCATLRKDCSRFRNLQNYATNEALGGSLTFDATRSTIFRRRNRSMLRQSTMAMDNSPFFVLKPSSYKGFPSHVWWHWMPLSWPAHAGEIAVSIIREDKQSCSFVPARHSNVWGKQWSEELRCIDMLRIRVDIWIFFTYIPWCSMISLYTLGFLMLKLPNLTCVPNEIATSPPHHGLFAHIYCTAAHRCGTWNHEPSAWSDHKQGQTSDIEKVGTLLWNYRWIPSLDVAANYTQAEEINR